jgi:hypothetical protein
MKIICNCQVEKYLELPPTIRIYDEVDIGNVLAELSLVEIPMFTTYK